MARSRTPLPATGYALMDGEHAELLRWADEVRNRLAAGAHRDEVLYALDTLAQLALSHFEHEQQAMRAAAYPHRGAHTRGHRVLQRRLAELRARAASAELPAASARRVLAAWLNPHIAGADARFANWMQHADGRADSLDVRGRQGASGQTG